MQTLTTSETAQWLRAHDHYLILTHRRPDGDAAGCAAALCLGLRAIGKQADVWENPQFTPRYTPYLQGLTSRDLTQNATLISVDLASEQLFPLNLEQSQISAAGQRVQLAIDHHGSNSGFAEAGLVLPERAACGEIIYALLQLLDAPISSVMAEAIYIAVSTDTGCFKYANTTGNTLRVAADMKDLGADTFKINKLFFDSKPYSRLQLEARLTESMEFYAGGSVALCLLPKAWLEELKLGEDDIDSISGFARSVEGVEIGIVIREVENGAGKLSIRTSPHYNASLLCSRLGGGGHAGAAGATVSGGLVPAKEAILNVLSSEGIAL